MKNPLLETLNQPKSIPTNNPMLPQIKQLWNVVNSASNPQLALNQMAQNNPALANVLAVTRGKDPQQVFYQLCKQNNIDPNTVLSNLR